MTVSGWNLVTRGLLIAALPAACLAQSEPATVTSIRFWSLGDVTRVVIETSAETHFRSEKIERPDRVFFDLKARYGKKPNTIEVGDKQIRKIRVAETQPKVTRVVFDLESHVEYSASQLTNPDRLIIELRRPGASSPPAPVEPAAKAVESAVKTAPAPVPTQAGTSTARLRFDAAMLRRSPAPTRELPPMSVPPQVNVGAILSAPAPPRYSVPPVKEPAPPRHPAVATVNRTTARETVSRPAPPPAPAPASTATAAAERVASESLSDSAATASPARRNSNGARSMTRVLGLKIGRVVIDPGHGGHDHGTTGPNGLTEKELVLDVAHRLGELLSERLGSEVIFTRNDDTFIPLEQRTVIANQKRCDLFISIHANASPLKTASGVETYYLNFTTAKDALDVAARENAVSQKSVFELRELLQKIALKDKVEESREFASRVQTALIAATPKTGVPAKNRGVKRAPFVVLIGASMPSILTEIGFVSNPKEEALLKKTDYRQKLAEALYKGVAQYAGTLSHFQVARRSGD